MKWKQELFSYFPKSISDALSTTEDEGDLCEIRLRINRRIQLVYGTYERMLEHKTDAAECATLLELLCEHSVYAREEELRSCFITLPFGYRVGICGKGYCENGSLKRVSVVTGFNFRISRECIGAADEAMKYILKDGRAASTLVISAPGVGKTTLLRDAARSLSSGKNAMKVCIADERSEIAGSRLGIPMLDVGERSDVMDACPKSVAMSMMIRTMSPDVLITDEIATEADAKAVMDAAASGVSVIASAHAGSIAELQKRSAINALLKEGYFEMVLLLCRKNGSISTKRVM